jgi:hypothetical protein
VNAVDRQLFRASTIVTLGDGAKASFWQSSWLNGRAPMDLFPDLFKLAWRKNKTVKEEVHNQNWVRGGVCRQLLKWQISSSFGIQYKKFS